MVQMTILWLWLWIMIMEMLCIDLVSVKQHALYHSVITFAINAPYEIHHCALYSSINWTSFHNRGTLHWFTHLQNPSWLDPFLFATATFYILLHVQYPNPPCIYSERPPEQIASLVAPHFNFLLPMTGMNWKKLFNWTNLSPLPLLSWTF